MHFVNSSCAAQSCGRVCEKEVVDKPLLFLPQPHAGGTVMMKMIVFQSSRSMDCIAIITIIRH